MSADLYVMCAVLCVAVVAPAQQEVPLPKPAESAMTLTKALQTRRSVREFSPSPISLADVTTLLWAAQGVTSDSGGRTAPSAGALYPLEIYIVAAKVEGLAPGVYRYRPAANALHLVASGDRITSLSAAALGQQSAGQAPAVIAISAEYSRTTRKYGDRGVRYAMMEAGHAAQNVCLQTVALGLGTVTVGAFDDEAVKAVLMLPRSETPLYLMPIGKPRQ